MRAGRRSMTTDRKLDKSVIPPGGYCYRVEALLANEHLDNDIRRYGRDLRIFSYRPGSKSILCPYWWKTAYGTTVCRYLGKETFDASEDLDMELVHRFFGNTDPFNLFVQDWALPDEIKICGIHEEEPDD